MAVTEIPASNKTAARQSAADLKNCFMNVLLYDILIGFRIEDKILNLCNIIYFCVFLRKEFMLILG